MKGITIIFCCSLQLLHAQTLVREQFFPELSIPIQSAVNLGRDSLRVGGVNSDGMLEWADFKSDNKDSLQAQTYFKIKLNLNFKPTALEFIAPKQILIAGHRQDTLAWAVLEWDSYRILKQGYLPDSLRKGQINVVRRLGNGDIILGGKKYGDLLLIRMDSVGKILAVLNPAKAVKDEIFDIFENRKGHIYASGHLKDDIFNENLMYILTIDSSLSVSKFKMLGNTDSINVAYSTVTTPHSLLVTAGVTGNQGIISWLDDAQEVTAQLVLPASVGFKRMRLERITATLYQVWAIDYDNKLHVFSIK